MKTKKEEIIYWLTEFEKLSTSRIMGLIGTNLKYTKKYLNELLEQGMIIKEEETNATYWRKNDQEEKEG